MNVLSTTVRILFSRPIRAAPFRSAIFIRGFVGVSMNSAFVLPRIFSLTAAGFPMST
jgi:hypothetical protein